MNECRIFYFGFLGLHEFFGFHETQTHIEKRIVVLFTNRTRSFSIIFFYIILSFEITANNYNDIFDLRFVTRLELLQSTLMSMPYRHPTYN